MVCAGHQSGPHDVHMDTERLQTRDGSGRVRGDLDIQGNRGLDHEGSGCQHGLFGGTRVPRGRRPTTEGRRPGGVRAGVILEDAFYLPGNGQSNPAGHLRGPAGGDRRALLIQRLEHAPQPGLRGRERRHQRARIHLDRKGKRRLCRLELRRRLARPWDDVPEHRACARGVRGGVRLRRLRGGLAHGLERKGGPGERRAPPVRGLFHGFRGIFIICHSL